MSDDIALGIAARLGGECSARLVKAAKKGIFKNIAIYMVNIFHDNDCSSWKEKVCDCDPDIEILNTATKEILCIDANGNVKKRVKAH